MTTSEETILKAIVFNLLLPEHVRLEAAGLIGDDPCPFGCTCTDCAAFDASRAA
jgi:hypothetical protein